MVVGQVEVMDCAIRAETVAQLMEVLKNDEKVRDRRDERERRRKHGREVRVKEGERLER